MWKILLGVIALPTLTCVAIARELPKDTLVVCDDVRDPQTFDPFQQFSEKNHILIQQIQEGLVRFDPKGRIEPALAISWKRLSPLVMEFKLRPDVRFHDGSPFDAESVKFSLEKYADPGGGFPGQKFFSTVDHVEIIVADTVHIYTKIPDGLLLNRLAGLVTIVPKGYYQKVKSAGFSEHPIGTGPFKFERWDRGKQVALKANEDYWDPGKPLIRKLIFRFLPSRRQVKALLNGSVDLVTDLPGTQTLLVSQQSGHKIVKLPELYTFVASLNISTGPLSDERFRRAMNYAINKEHLIRYDAMGNGVPLASLAMPGEVGFNRDLKPYPYDPQKARELIRQTPYRDVRLKVFVKSQAERTARIIAKQLARVGVRLELTIVPDAEMHSALNGGTWDIIIGNCPDPMVHSFFIQAIILFSQSPFSVMRDQKYDEMLTELVSSLSDSEQLTKGRQLQRYIYEHALGLFTYQRIRTYGMRKDLQFEPYVTAMPYFHTARYAWSKAN